MVVLPDGSKVWLNAGSELRYKNSFNSKLREVELEGEAFFEVMKDHSKLFKVNTGKVSVEVYGTAFNVKNYKEENNLEVTVESGNVGVVGNGCKLADLAKGKQLSMNRESNAVTLTSPDLGIITAWKNNELVFDGTPFEEVIRYLERWYGVNITIEEKMKRKHNYTFKVKTESFRELLELLKEITPLQYKIDGKNVSIKYAK
jgi:ferric-dicitrate binding protein FerR (iron transport regulator)